jgi:3-hydroxyacyl-[acyl-carrier-protein] dehydratase
MDKLTNAIKNYSLGPSQINNPSEITNEYCFDQNFIGFSGHFPEYPILPAVVQLIVAQLLIEEQKGHKIRVKSIEKAKFLSEIKPDEKITVQCIDADKNENQRSKVKITSGDRQISSFIISFCLPEEDMNC